METGSGGVWTRMRGNAAAALAGPAVLAFMPAITLGAFWIGGEAALLGVSLGLPMLLALSGAFRRWPAAEGVARDSVTGLVLRDGFETRLKQVFDETAASGLKSACLVVELDDCKQVSERHGQGAADQVIQRTGERIVAALRSGDLAARTGDSRFSICLQPVRQMDLELCLQMSGRLQSALEEPIALDGTTLYLSCSVGFCLRSRAPGKDADGWIEAAATALREAQQNGPSAIRSYSADMHRRSKSRSDLRDDAASALEKGHIHPWFQPQISTDTGKVTGFEALARWSHPHRGMVPPEEFIPALSEAGLQERFGEVILYHALTALKAWDSAGMSVPTVGVNFSQEELRNPKLVDRIRWELDRFDLAPGRLNVEILETVVANGPDDIVAMNIRQLSELGCGIDLDDYGTGHASISSIRRFPVTRIKIDRSFVMKADRDPQQQKLVAALLSMAERLGLETLAEGVETVGEHALLAQLGCDHVQGFGIGRPMPFDQTLDWIVSHLGKLEDAPRIGRETG